MTNIATVLDDQAALHPEVPAIREVINGHSRTTTFAQLSDLTRSFCLTFQNEGLKPGDDVLVLHPITAELYAVILALFRAGCTVMLLDPSAGLEHITRCCKIRMPTAFVGSNKAHLLRLVSRPLRTIPLKFSVGSWVPGAITISLKEAASPTFFAPAEPCNDDQPALLTFTSGGTGVPKAAVRTHGFLLAQNCVLARTLELQAGEIDLATLPVFILANIAAGVTTVIPNCDLRYPGRVNASAVMAQIERERPMTTACSPAFIERISTAAISAGIPLTSFRRIYTGGAPVTPALLDLASRAAPQATVVAVYGSTEAEPIAELPHPELSSEVLANVCAGGGLPAGKPVREITLRIIQDNWGQPLGNLSQAEFDKMSLACEGRGEIVVTGDHVLKGYLDGRGDEETKFEVTGRRWHRTGDAGYLDKNGWLWLLGRCQSIIRDERGTLYPFAVEMVALQHTAVARAALLYYDEKRVLFIQTKNGIPAPLPDEICTLMPWAQLDEIRVLKEIPLDRRHNAKVDYPRLKAMLQ